jgi:phosphomannomutase
MNRAVVRRTAAGLAAQLLAGASGPVTVVVGRDARHGSVEFQADAGAVLAGAGVRALLLPRDLPTPVLAFAVLHLGADAGVMVTGQPQPARRQRHQGLPVRRAPAALAGRRARRAADRRGALVLDLPARRGRGARRGRLAGLPVGDLRAAAQCARDVRVAYTPMHGVGLETLLAAFDRAGFAPPAVVAEQAAPDPDFPTVAFPNPEEPGALDLLLRLSATPTWPSPRTRTPTGSPSPWATARCAATRPACCSPTTCCRRGCAAGWPPPSSAPPCCRGSPRRTACRSARR